MAILHRWRDLGVRAKLACGFTGVCLTFVIATAFCAVEIADLRAHSHVVADESVPMLDAATVLGTEFQRYRLRHYRALEAAPAEREAIMKSIGETQASLAKSAEHLAGLTNDAQDRAQVDSLRAAFAEYFAVMERTHPALSGGRGAQERVADVWEKDARPLVKDRIEPALTAIEDHARKESKAGTSKVASDAGVVLAALIGAVAAACALSALFAWALMRSIVEPVQALMGGLANLADHDLPALEKRMRAMREGDLTTRVQATGRDLALDRRDEFGRLAQSYNQMVGTLRSAIDASTSAQESLAKTITSILGSADTVATAGLELTQSAGGTHDAAAETARSMELVARAAGESNESAHQIARGGEMLANNTSRAAAAMEALDQAIAEVREVTADQLSSAERARQDADAGGSQVAELVHSMQRTQQ